MTAFRCGHKLHHFFRGSLSPCSPSLSHSLVTRRYITLATYFYDFIARWLSRNGLLWSRFPLSKLKMKGEALSCLDFPEVLEYSCSLMYRSSSLVDTASQKWSVQLGLGIGKSLLSLSPWPRRCRCRPILISFLPSFGGPEITWRFHEYPPSLPRSIVCRSPRVCPLRPVGAANGARSLRE